MKNSALKSLRTTNKKSGSISPQPRSTLMRSKKSLLGKKAGVNQNSDSTQYLEFSLKESDHNKLFQSVRFSSPS
jgi:hypothetical protein